MPDYQAGCSSCPPSSTTVCRLNAASVPTAPMASRQRRAKDEEEGDLSEELVAQAGTGPEYEYPTTKKDEPIPVVEDVSDEDPGDVEEVPGEDAPPLKDKDIREMEKEEEEETEEWSEDLAQNEPLPGEVEDELPDEMEKDRSADD